MFILSNFAQFYTLKFKITTLKFYSSQKKQVTNMVFSSFFVLMLLKTIFLSKYELANEK